MDCSMSGFPVLHYLLEFAQTYVHCITAVTVVMTLASHKEISGLTQVGSCQKKTRDR